MRQHDCGQGERLDAIRAIVSRETESICARSMRY